MRRPSGVMHPRLIYIACAADPRLLRRRFVFFLLVQFAAALRTLDTRIPGFPVSSRLR